MSTRATVWVLNKETGDERFLYHHWDGYMLDDEIDPILKNLPDDKWNVDDVSKAIIDYDEAYGKHKVDGVGWDSEYVYKIEVSERTMDKFNCGISDFCDGDRKEEKTQEKYMDLEKRYSYKRKEFNDETKSQIIQIQLVDIIKYACECLKCGVVNNDDVDKIQEMFKIVHRDKCQS